ncbi:SUMF1/EgtB/PvdO family nonheme iron enzyme [Alteromonas sp. A081]|uniref:SUMF1/EgtB/PvdO family nonheme iron enzyme n=1 Tax=Alteromonas sp. A081 TaxID=3410269 RepID=UPI003B97E39B
MSSIDEAIAKGKRRRKSAAIFSLIGLSIIIAIYFSWLFLTKGYAFSVYPDDAAKAPQFSVLSGTAFFISDKLYVIGSTADVTVSAAKYKPTKLTIDGQSPSTINVKLVPLPATLTISTAPVVPDISWYVNGEKVAASTTLKTELPEGQYDITAVHPFFNEAVVSITAEKADVIEKELTLTPVTGSMTINSVPSGAAVSINGEEAGNTPLTMTKFGGRYDVSLMKEGFEPLHDAIEVSNQRLSPRRDYNLQALQAQLSIEVTPPGGIISINGKPTASNASVSADVSHSITYEKPGFVAQRKSVKLSPGEQKTIPFELAQEMGDVSFTSSLTSQVFIDGVNRGETPLRLRLQTLPTRVSFQRGGYRTVEKKITPNGNSLTTVNAEMLTEFDARRRDGTPLFISTLGIQLSLISPKSFTMGSPPNEQDRKRNEYQRNVDFSRQVWISRHEITQGQYAAFVGQNKSKQTKDAKQPITDVSWEDAVAFTNWLSEKEGLTPFYAMQGKRVVGINTNAKGYRLPTEAEWEFIAKMNRRASPTTFVWGNQQRIRDKQGNFADASLKGKQTFILKDYDDGFAGAAPVGSFDAERGGFFDLDGNVREWVHDVYSVTPPQSSGTALDYLGPTNGNKHVVKGASFKIGRLKNIRASVRSGETSAQDDIGFRIARYEN